MLASFGYQGVTALFAWCVFRVMGHALLLPQMMALRKSGVPDQVLANARFFCEQCGVVCVGFSSDVRRLATGDEDNLVCVWDTRTGAMLFRTDQHPQRVAVAVFHQG